MDVSRNTCKEKSGVGVLSSSSVSLPQALRKQFIAEADACLCAAALTRSHNAFVFEHN